MTDSVAVFRGKNTVKEVLIPSVLFSIQRELVLPILPLFTKGFNVEGNDIGLLVSCYGIGRLLGNVPAGALVNKMGTKPTVFFGFFLDSIGATICLWSNSLVKLMIGRVISGFGMSSFDVGRQMYISKNVDKEIKGRLSSTLGAIRRGGIVISPIISGLILEHSKPTYVFMLQITLNLLNSVWCYIYFPGMVNQGEPTTITTNNESQLNKLSSIIRGSLALVIRIGVFCFALKAFRSSSAFTFPTQGIEMGLTETVIASVVSTGFLVDFLTVPLGGTVIDRYGRKVASLVTSCCAAVSYVLFCLLSFYREGLGRAALPLLYGVSCISGFTNGISAGLIMTMMQDVAQTVEMDKRGVLIALYKVFADTGDILGPIAVGWLSVYSLAAALFGLTTFAVATFLWVVCVMVSDLPRLQFL